MHKLTVSASSLCTLVNSNWYQLFTQFLKSLNPILKQAGFSQSHSNFRHRADDNWAVINFQRSSSSTTVTPRFTINLGIYSAVLAKIFPSFRMRTDASLKPLVIDSHWRLRVGDLLPQNKDVWWQFTSDPMESCREEVDEYLTTLVIPTLQQYSSDAALRELWATGSLLGVDSEIVRLEYLSLLAKVYGTEDEVVSHLESLQRIGGKTTMHIMKRAPERL